MKKNHLRSSYSAPLLFDKLLHHDRAIGRQQWREILQRDITRLLNDSVRGMELELAAFPDVEHSVFNHGLPPFAAVTGGAVDADYWGQHLQRILRIFEPRLDPRTIRVAPILHSQGRNMLALLFDIHGVVLQHVENISIDFRIAFDYSCGEIRIVDD